MPAALTCQRVLERALSAHRDRIAAKDGDRTLTYAELDRRSARLANVLLAAGACADLPAATMLPNRLEYVEFDVACTRAGITRVGISERLSSEEAGYILTHSGAAVLVTTPSFLDSLEEFLPDTLRQILVVDGGAGPTRGADYEAALAAASATLSVATVAPETPCYIMYTSGTTGRPKGATHSQGTRYSGTLNMLACELHLTVDSVMVHAGPLTHGSGSKVLATLVSGGCNVVLGKFTPEALAAAVTEDGGTHTFLVPTMLQRICNSSAEVVDRIRGMRQISFGGSPISPGVFAGAIEALGPRLTQVYGSSEAPHPVSLLRPDDYAGRTDDTDLLRSAGRVSLATEVRTVDDEGEDVAVDAAGELWIRSPQVMTGYWRDPEATAATFAPDGWFRSGDVVRVDRFGVITFEDRKKDLIITGGLNVYPSEVERVLAEHERIDEVAVLGYPDPEWGESIIAFVVPTAAGSVTAEEVQEWARLHLAGYKKPRRVEFRDRLPLGSSNKVLKRALRDELWKDQERRVG